MLAELVQKKEACGRERAELEKLIGLDNVTRDGRKINVYANIGSPEDVDKVLLNDAGGIGLFRSEFLYLGREDYPSEEETSRWITSSFQKKKIQRWAIVRSVSVWIGLTCLKHSSVQFTERPFMVLQPSCSR